MGWGKRQNGNTRYLGGINGIRADADRTIACWMDDKMQSCEVPDGAASRVVIILPPIAPDAVGLAASIRRHLTVGLTGTGDAERDADENGG